MSDITVTLSSKVSVFEVKKWDIVRIDSSNQEFIVTKQNMIKEHGTFQTTLHPYEKQDTKFAQWVWFKLLKLLVFIRLI